MWRLALKNLKGRKAYSAIIAGAAAAAAAMTLLAFFMSLGIRTELERSRVLLGPDLAIVPPGTKETGHIYLSLPLPPIHQRDCKCYADNILLHRILIYISKISGYLVESDACPKTGIEISAFFCPVNFFFRFQQFLLET